MSALASVRARLGKVWGGYRRFGGLIATYARPHWRLFLVLVVLNFAIIALTTGLTVMTAATLNVLAAPADQLPGAAAAAPAAGTLNLSSIGALAYRLAPVFHLQGRFQLVAAFAGLALLSGLLKSALSYLSSVLALRAGAFMARQMQYDVFTRVLGFSLRFFHRHRTGELMGRIAGDTSNAMQECARILNTLLVSPFVLAFYLVLVIRTSWVLFAGIVLAGLAHHFISLLLSAPIRRAMRRMIDASAEIGGILQEALANIRVVKAFAAEPLEAQRFRDSIVRFHRISVRGSALEGAQGPARLVVNQIVQFVIVIVAALAYTQGRIAFVACLLFIYICQSIVDPIKQISEAYVLSGRMLAMVSRVFELLGTPTDMVDGTRPVEGFRESLRLEEATFAYEAAPVIRGVSLDIRKGEMLALVGPSGGGKSTLTDLLLRFYDPSGGRVTLDGVDVRELRLHDYRSLFGVVSQEPLLFHTTLRENILYGRPHLTEADMRRAAEAAHAVGFIEAMPEKYETLVGDRGIRLSGGQRQRIAIARAIAGRPAILVLDEATSALDSESEREVQHAITEISRTTTSIVIAHRLSTVLHADRIAYVEAGRIVGIGQHDALLRACPGYRRLCEIQFRVGAPAGEGRLS